ncbi:MAG: AMP-binding protein [Lachnospiraceae bacterium]|nr:AMP-binding protein [Lachnospiraceae bacterium]
MVSDANSRSVIYEQFKKVAEKSPAQTAIVEEIRSLTYRELDQRIQRIAEKFSDVETPRADGAKGVCIGIVTDHGMDQIASIFAVLKTGAAYVPAEPDFPEERIRFMMKEGSVGQVTKGNRKRGRK